MCVYVCGFVSVCACVYVCVRISMWVCGRVQHPFLWCPERSITLSSSNLLKIQYFSYFFFYFLRDYTSPHTLRVEFGIAEEMNQFDCSFKVRQMLGPNPAK